MHLLALIAMPWISFLCARPLELYMSTCCRVDVMRRWVSHSGLRRSFDAAALMRQLYARIDAFAAAFPIADKQKLLTLV